jgi:hypothetical protein
LCSSTTAAVKKPDSKITFALPHDFGAGLQPTLYRQDTSMRMGLGLISQLSSYFEIGAGRHGGTVVRMRMPLSG